VRTKDVIGAAFQYGKILSLPFFGAGIVEIPPNGYKREKNSRKNHMIFFIETGKVDVTVEQNDFTISKGGSWQVPRGKF
jgi:centromere protein C